MRLSILPFRTGKGAQIMPQVITRDILRVTTSNVQATHSTSAKNARSESNVAINPLNAKHIVGASKKFIDPEQYRFTLSAVVSFDAAKTWQEAAPFPLLPGWDGISDPALAWDAAGGVYLVALPLAPQNKPGEADTLGIAVYKSFDGGLTWGNPTLIHSSTGDDKQWAASDTSPSSPYYGRVYAVWDDTSVMRFARTSDNGATWRGLANVPITQTSLATDSFSPEISVAPNGEILIVYWNRYSSGTKEMKFLRSTDGGESFSSPVTVASPIVDIEKAFPSTNGWSHFPGSTFRILTVATGCAGANGEVLIAWADAREQVQGRPVSRIYYRRSPDGGQTWDGPPSGQPLVLPNVDAAVMDGVTHDFHPAIVAAPREMAPSINNDMSGAIACAFYRLSPKQGKNCIDVIVAASVDGGMTFPLITTVTEQPWDPAVAAPHSHGDPTVTFIGEYFGFDASSLGFVPLWTDTRTGMQELFSSSLRIDKSLEVDGGAISGTILGGVAQDGGGFVILPGGRVIKIPPYDPAFDVLPALGIYRMADDIKNSDLRDTLKTAAIEAVGATMKRITSKNQG
jgi:hypothetical protein